MHGELLLVQSLTLGKLLASKDRPGQTVSLPIWPLACCITQKHKAAWSLALDTAELSGYEAKL